MRNSLIFVIGVVSMASLGLAQSTVPSYVVHGKCNDGLPGYTQWLSKTALPYAAGQERKQEIVQGYAKLKLQMTVDDVKQLLGPPDFSSPRPSGHLSTVPAPETPVCNDQLAYIVDKKSDNMADTEDAAIFLFFSPEKKLTWAAPQNIPGLSQIGGPATN